MNAADETPSVSDDAERAASQPQTAQAAPESVAPAVERAAPVAGPEPGFTDTLTLSFADPQATAFGVIALELGEVGSVAALVFADGELVASYERSELPAELARWQTLSTDALSLEIDAAGWSWVVEMRIGAVELTVEFLPLADPFIYEAGSAPAAASGMARSERLCHAVGTLILNGRERVVDGRGQRSHQWGPAPWPSLESWRSLAVWLDDDRGLALWGTRPAGATAHDRETVAAWLIEGQPSRAVEIAEPRISTTYDAHGGPLRAGLELWVGADDSVAYRAAGEVVCAGTVSVGHTKQLWSFLDWRMDGHAGPGALALATPGAPE